MTSQDKAVPVLLDLGNPGERQARSDLIDRAMHTALTLLDADAVAILITPSARRERLVLHAGSQTAAAMPLPPEGSDALQLLTETAAPLLVPDLSEEPRITRDGCPGIDAGPVLFTPLQQRNGVHGYIGIYRRGGRARFTMNDTRQMLLVAAWLGFALESHRLTSATEKVSVTDDLTNVYNYRFLKAALNREIRRASRFGQALSLVVIDLDDRESKADESPAPSRDGLLKELASVLAPQVRTFDIVARYREDKFMLILPQTDREGATLAAERMRAAVERHAFPQAEAGTITVSLGVASYPQDAADPKDLAAAAKRALHEAKQRSGNCVATLAIQDASPRSAPEVPRIKEWTRTV